MLDRSLLKRIFSAPNSDPKAALYIETGTMTIGTIIKARRLNFLQYLVKLPKEEMLSRFFHCRWLYNSGQEEVVRSTGGTASSAGS